MTDATTAQQAAGEQDPKEMGAKPEFGEQKQQVPGTEAEMQEKPDHGEESYRGHNRLEGKAAIITGGDSGIGRAVALAFAREGADVLISYLPEEEPDAPEAAPAVRPARPQAGRRGAGARRRPRLGARGRRRPDLLPTRGRARRPGGGPSRRAGRPQGGQGAW